MKAKCGVLITALVLMVVGVGCAQRDSENIGAEGKTKIHNSSEKIMEHPDPVDVDTTIQQEKREVKKITFVELGSVKCIPCKKMQPILEEIENKYNEQIDVVFYDVWTEEGGQYAEKYGIRLIPTQVFLDKDGKEYFRHEGFYPLEEVIARLKEGGLKE